MFDNLKELFSVVQEGLSSSSNLRHAFSEVQKAKFPEKTQSKVELNAGAGQLSQYQCQWADLHAESEECASGAERLDRLVTSIHERVTTRLINASDLSQSLANLPKLSAAVDECIQHLEQLGELIVTVERELSELEDLVDRHDVAKRKINHHYHLSIYKEKKLEALEEKRVAMAAESSQKHAERERRQMSLLQGRSKASGEAFSYDVAQYQSTGLPPHRSPQPSQSLTLEQVELEDSNKEDLDAFLDS